MRRIVLGVLLSLAVVSCAQDAATSAAEFTLFEFGIDGSVENLAAGPVTLTVRNSGEFAHTLVVAEHMGAVLTATEVLAAGESVVLDLDLAPGSYEFTCRIVGQREDGSIVDHFEEGMEADIEVLAIAAGG